MTLVMMAMVVGPHERGASRGPDDHGGGRSAWERSIKNNAMVLEKKKSELTTKERSYMYERKCVTHQKEKRGQENEAASLTRRRTARHVAYEGKHTQNEYFQYI